MQNKTIILQNGAEMPLIGLGTWQANDPLQLRDAMNAALKCGYRHFDTAYLYKNENIVGKVIEEWIRKGLVKREELFITTKLPLAGVHPDRVELFLDKSLKNLGLDYVDLYLVHFPVCVKYYENNDLPVNEAGELQAEPSDHVAVWKKMEDMVDLGKARAIGLSNFTKDQTAKILEKSRIKPNNMQIEIHLYHQNNELVEFCKQHGISLVAFSPLGSPALNLFNEKRGYPTTNVPKIMADEIVISVARKYSKSPVQVMLRFLIQNGIAAIPKSITPSRIKENIDIFNFELDEIDMHKLRKLDRGELGRICDCKGFKIDDHPDFPFGK